MRIKCPSCKQKNEIENKSCKFCGALLSENNYNDPYSQKDRKALIVFTIVILIVFSTIGIALMNPSLIDKLNFMSNNEEKNSIIESEINSEIEEKDLIGYWNFNKIVDDKISDDSEYNNYGYVYGQELTNGISSNALYFNGNYGYVYVQEEEDSKFKNLSEFTISLYIKRANFSRVISEGLFSKGTTAYNKGFNLAISKNNTIRFVIRDEENSYKLHSEEVINKDVWYHIIAIWDGKYMKLFIQDELDGEKYVGDIQIPYDSKPIEFGNHWGYTDNNQPYHGTLDEIKLFNYASPSKELVELT